MPGNPVFLSVRGLKKTVHALILMCFLDVTREGSSAYFHSSSCGVQISSCSAFAQDGVFDRGPGIRKILSSI